MSVEKVADDDQEREKLYRLIIVVLVGVLVATWVAVIWLVQGKNSAEEDLARAEKDLKRLERDNAAYAAGPDAKVAAERILGEMISFDYREIGAEYEWTKYLANKELRSDYEDNIVPRISKVIRRTKATAEGKIVKSAYDIGPDDQVVVLAFIRQTLTDADNKDGVISEQWASLTMVPEGDDWLIDKVDIVSVPPPS